MIGVLGVNMTDSLASLLITVAGADVILLTYMLFKVFYRRDFGVPVRRKLFRMSLSVERDQIAFAPYWWSDLQVQRAIKSHWKHTLRQTCAPATHAHDPA